LNFASNTSAIPLLLGYSSVPIFLKSTLKY
jgi:hypothetical protein